MTHLTRLICLLQICQRLCMCSKRSPQEIAIFFLFSRFALPFLNLACLTDIREVIMDSDIKSFLFLKRKKRQYVTYKNHNNLNLTLWPVQKIWISIIIPSVQCLWLNIWRNTNFNDCFPKIITWCLTVVNWSIPVWKRYYNIQMSLLNYSACWIGGW